jgi:signal transduction histidine kinase
MGSGSQRSWDVHPGGWLISTILVVALVFLGATAYQTATAARIDHMASDIADNADPSIRHLSAARTELHAIDDAVTAGFLDHVPARALRRSVAAHEERMRSELDAYAALPFFPTEFTLWAGKRDDIARAETEVASVIERLEAGDAEGARTIRTTALADAIRRADVGLENLILFDTDHASRLGEQITTRRRRAERTMWLLDALALSLAGVMLVVGKRAIDADTQMRTKLARVASSAVSISESVSADGEQASVFRAAVDAACSVTDATMCALGVGTDPEKPFDPFVGRGFDASEIAKIRAHGPASDRVGPFMSVPLRHLGEMVGSLYLAKPPGAPRFTEQDERAVELLATITGTAAHNATLYESLRKAVIAREDLLSIVSHDLRNPLSAIIVGAALVKRTLPADAPAKGTVDIVARNAARMETMIRDLLTASKLREGKLAVEPRPVAVGDLLTETADAFDLALRDHGITLAVELAPNVPPVSCDPARIAQVHANLVGNALKFTPKGGSITNGAKPSGDEVVFSVRDTGVGIEPAAATHVFDRYWQKSEDATRGTGLGLFIVKGIIESHGGRVWVESKPGEGSDFRFTLPVVH